MQAQKLPMNIDLLILTDDVANRLQRIEVLDIFDGVSTNYHAKGLFSTEIFGKVGDPRRETTFAYINLNIDIFHPYIYKTILKLKAFYGEILSGKGYAIFDDKIKDFVKSNPIEGETGYHFFMKNFKKLNILKNDSIKRDYYVDLLERYKTNCTMNKLIVMPAAYRDIEIDKNNKQTENEINKLYRKVLGYANLIKDINTDLNIEYVNNIRYNIQNTVLEIYTYIKEMLEGKRGMIQDKWASRKIFNSTRNVISSYTPNVTSLNDPRKVSANQTVVGLYQMLKVLFPYSVKLIRDDILTKVFQGPNSPMLLVNKETYKKEMVPLDSKLYDSWMTVDGIEKQINMFSRDDIRFNVIETDKHYLGLVYKGNDGTYRFVQDKDDVPKERMDNGTLEPITFTELMALSIYKHISDIPAFVTRYPITEYGSIYPCYMYLRTTIRSEIRYELDDNWEKTDIVFSEYPVKGEKFFEAMYPGHSHLARLGADIFCPH